MERTQIYLTEVEVDLLKRESERTGASKAELIRRAIQAHYGRSGPQDRGAALRRTAGSWKGRNFSGATYTRALRGDLEKRLSELGLT
jgi:hypothetical protein